MKRKVLVMQTIAKLALIDAEKCNVCTTCIRVCPTKAISLDKSHEKPVVVIDDQKMSGLHHLHDPVSGKGRRNGGAQRASAIRHRLDPGGPGRG